MVHRAVMPIRRGRAMADHTAQKKVYFKTPYLPNFQPQGSAARWVKVSDGFAMTIADVSFVGYTRN